MIKYAIIYSIIMIILSLLFNREESRDKDLSKRMKQATRMERKSLIEERIESSIKDRVDIAKRRKIVLELEQAGFDVSYSEYFLFRIFVGLVIGLATGIVLSNIFLAIIFSVIGFLTPHQVVMFIRNKRVTYVNKQMGSFMNMLSKRYEMSRDMSKALKDTAKEFKGEEPLYSEINKTIMNIDLGMPVADSLNDFASRIDNKYMKRFASYYEMASLIGTDDLRKNLLNQASRQYNENEALKQLLAKEIAGPVQEAYIMVVAVPAIGLYQAMTNPDYIYFFTKVPSGKFSLAVIVGILLGVVWFIHNKLGASIE